MVVGEKAVEMAAEVRQSFFEFWFGRGVWLESLGLLLKQKESQNLKT